MGVLRPISLSVTSTVTGIWTSPWRKIIKDEVWVVLGKGDGTFQPVTIYSTGEVEAKVRGRGCER